MPNITSKNAKLTFVTTTGVTINFQDFAADSMMGVDDVENVVSKIGIDGRIARYVKSVLISGNLKFLATSPTVAEIDQLLIAQTEESTPVTGVLTSVIVATGKTYVYDDFCILSAPKGRALGESVEDVTYKWDSNIPNISSNPSASLGLIDRVRNGLSNLANIKSTTEKINNLFK